MTPNHRNLSTVGIDGFVCDPGNDLEIAGDIKTNPEDFLVREIGYVPPSRSVETAERSTAGGNNYHQMERLGWIRALAGLQNEGQAADEVCEPASKKKPRTKVDLEDEATSRCDVSSPTVDLDSTSQVAQKTIDEVKAKDLAEFLLQQDGINVEATLEKLRSLHDSALASVTSSIEKSGQNEDGRLKVCTQLPFSIKMWALKVSVYLALEHRNASMTLTLCLTYRLHDTHSRGEGVSWSWVYFPSGRHNEYNAWPGHPSFLL